MNNKIVREDALSQVLTLLKTFINDKVDGVGIGQVKSDISTIKEQLNTILEGDTDAIDKWNEVESFLQGITDTETLTSLLLELKKELEDYTDSKFVELDTNGYEYVDMGEAGIWAKYPIGVTNWETALNDALYFEWGGIEGYTSKQVTSGEKKFSINYTDYRFSGEGATGYENPQLTKYCNNTQHGKDGFVDHLLRLELEDDAAHVIMKGSWRIPTIEELKFLCDKCNLEYVSNYNDINITGLLCTLKTDESKQLFFPALGDCDSGTNTFRNSWGYYASSDMNENDSVFSFSFGQTGYLYTSFSASKRYIGRSIIGFIPAGNYEKYLTKKEAEETYQPKGDYLTSIVAQPGERQIVYTTIDNTKAIITDSDITTDATQDSIPTTIFENIESHEYYENKGYGVVTIKNNVVTPYLFAVNNKLKTVQIGSGFTVIGAGAFRECANLESFNIPDGVTSLKYCCFARLPKYISVYLPDSVTYLNMAFYYSNVIHVRLSPNITDWYRSFDGSLLTSVVIPEGITDIAASAFRDCHNLKSVVLPKTVTKIGDNAFYKCPLGDIYFPNVKFVGNHVFGYGDDYPNSDEKYLGEICLPNLDESSENKRAFNGIGRCDKIEIPANITKETWTGQNWPTVVVNHASWMPNIFKTDYLTTLYLRYASSVVEGVETYLKNNAAFLGKGQILNDLHIYVPSALLSDYRTTYPNIASHFYPINGKDDLHDPTTYFSKEEANQKFSEIDSDLESMSVDDAINLFNEIFN